jgi:hypothetical protein
MHEELENFERNHIWTLVEPPRDVNVIETKCVFKNKQGEDGEVVRNKARLVAQGFSQVEGLDFGEIGFLLVVLVHVDSHTRSSHLPRCLHVAWSDRVDPHMKFPDFIFPQLVSVFTFTGGFFLRNGFLIGHNIFVLLDFFSLEDFSVRRSLLFIRCILVPHDIQPQIQCGRILGWYVLVQASSLLVWELAQSLPKLCAAGLCHPALSSLRFRDLQCFEFLLPL